MRCAGQLALTLERDVMRTSNRRSNKRSAIQGTQLALAVLQVVAFGESWNATARQISCAHND